jgi:Rrf2 family protein
MLTATTENAIRALIYLARLDSEQPVSPRQIAQAVGGSPTYMAKIAGSLTRAGILRSRNGVAGGIHLARPAANITLLEIVQACQGIVTADYCDALGAATAPEACGFHQAMYELHQATVRSLSRWTLKMLAAKPVPVGKLSGNTHCRMASLASACETCDHLKAHRPAGGKTLRGKAA